MIEVIQGDIVSSDTVAIVNAANTELVLGSGVAGAIARHGGKAIQEECYALSPIREGDAVITGAGNLKQKYVIHAVAPNGEIEGWEDLVSNCIKSILSICEEKEIESVAIPAIGTGVFGLPIKRVAELLVQEATQYTGEIIKRIVFVLFDDEAYLWFSKALEENKG